MAAFDYRQAVEIRDALARHQVRYLFIGASGAVLPGFPAGMLAFLSLYDGPAARPLVMRTVPRLREHQADDGLWHHEDLHRNDWGRPARPPEPRLAALHIVSALHKFGALRLLRPSRRRRREND